MALAARVETPSPQGQAQNEGIECKGAVFRGYVLALKDAGLLAAVRERVSPATRELLDDPPPISAWMTATHNEEILEAVAALRGPNGVRAVARAATTLGVAPVVRAAVEGFLRMFGVSSLTVFARLGQLTASTVRGAEYEWAATSPTGGVLVLRYPKRTRVPWNIFVSAAGGFEAIFDFCSEPGIVDGPDPLPGSQNAARYRITVGK